MDDHKAPPGSVRADTLMQRVGDWFYATRDHWKPGCGCCSISWRSA